MPETVADIVARTGRTTKDVWAQIKRGKLARTSRGRYDPTSDAPGWLRSTGGPPKVGAGTVVQDEPDEVSRCPRCGTGILMVEDFPVRDDSEVQGRHRVEMRELFADGVASGEDIRALTERHRQEWIDRGKLTKHPECERVQCCCNCGSSFWKREVDDGDVHV